MGRESGASSDAQARVEMESVRQLTLSTAGRLGTELAVEESSGRGRKREGDCVCALVRFGPRRQITHTLPVHARPCPVTGSMLSDDAAHTRVLGWRGMAAGQRGRGERRRERERRGEREGEGGWVRPTSKGNQRAIGPPEEEDEDDARRAVGRGASEALARLSCFSLLIRPLGCTHAPSSSPATMTPVCLSALRGDACACVSMCLVGASARRRSDAPSSSSSS